LRYVVHQIHAMMSLSIRYNMLPLFHEDGVLRDRMYIRGIDDEKIELAWAEDSSRVDAYLRPISSRGKSMRLDIRLTKLDGVKLRNDVAIEPMDGGVILYFDGTASPGKTPNLVPIYIKRIRFRTPKTIPHSTSGRSIHRIYLMNNSIKKKIGRNYKALSHIGGSLFLFTDDPFKYRRPFLELYRRDMETGEEVFVKLPSGLMSQLGFAGQTFKCFDFIEDTNDRHYIFFNQCGETLMPRV